MSQFYAIHPENPQARLISQAVAQIREGGVVIYPTDSGYALGCLLENKSALERICRIRQIDSSHNFTLVCRDLSELSLYSKVDNQAFRLIKNNTPGPYTFILPATKEVPRRLSHPKKKTVGVRIPDNEIVRKIIAELGEPILSSSLILPEIDSPLTEGWQIKEELDHVLDAVVEAGDCGNEPTTVIDYSEGAPEIVRTGAGDTARFE